MNFYLILLMFYLKASCNKASIFGATDIDKKIEFYRKIYSFKQKYPRNYLNLTIKIDLSEDFKSIIKLAASPLYNESYSYLGNKKLKILRKERGLLDSLLAGAGGFVGNQDSQQPSNDFHNKIEEYKKGFEDVQNKEKSKKNLDETISELQISNDVAFNGLDEFKLGDIKVMVNEDNRNDMSDTIIDMEFPNGVGMYIALECFHESREEACMNLFINQTRKTQKSCGNSAIPSSHVIGTGFLISKDTIDKTRRKQLVSKFCNMPIKYGPFNVPDGISLKEIYDSEAQSLFFGDSSQFVSYLSSSYGTAITDEEMNSLSLVFAGGLPILFSGNFNFETMLNIKNTNNKEKLSNLNKEIKKSIMMSLFEINIIRYALSLDNPKPENLDPFFLIDFMSLPENYFLADGPEKYEKFIFRYGTHYISSAEFGGQILFENSRVVDSVSDMNDLAQQSSKEFQRTFGASLGFGLDTSLPIEGIKVEIGGKSEDSFISAAGDRKSNENMQKQRNNKQRNWTNVFIQSQGGDINVAKLITRLDSSMVGVTLSEWLRSIPKRPKAFKMKMRPIYELLNINVRRIFMEGTTNEICRKTKTKKCVYGTTLNEFQEKFDRRRRSLEFAIDIYRHKTPLAFSDLEIPAGSLDSCTSSVHQNSKLFPTYDEILNGMDVKVTFELIGNYEPFQGGEEIFLLHHNGLWFSHRKDENYNFLRAFRTPSRINGDLVDEEKKMNFVVIRNLVFHYNDTNGYLKFIGIGQGLESHTYMSNKDLRIKEMNIDSRWKDYSLMKRIKVARVSYMNVLQGIHNALNNRFFIMPCHLDWSLANSKRFAISSKNAKCLKFVASSFGDIFVVFATNPNNEWTWYYFQISSYGVALYRAGLVVKYQLDLASGSLKSNELFRAYFICMAYEQRALVTDDIINWREINVNVSNSDDKGNFFGDDHRVKENLRKKYTSGIFIQFGIVRGFESHEDVKLSFFDENPLEPRYYMFGSYDAKVNIYDVTVSDFTMHDEINLRCLSNNEVNGHCLSLCHESCLGCYSFNSSSSCVKCRFSGRIVNNKLICSEDCPRAYKKNLTANFCQDIDECKTNQTKYFYKNGNSNEVYEWEPCDPLNGICTNTNGSYTCKCKSGFTGDGFACKDIDECIDQKIVKNKCPENSICVNTPGSFTCMCKQGFKENNYACTDINECEEGTHQCQRFSKCINTIGSYQCKCLPGFIGNGQTCSDIDECSLSIHKCPTNTQCMNQPGSYHCECGSGSIFINKKCIDIENCRNPNKICPRDAHCASAEGIYYCKCNDGLTPILSKKTRNLVACHFNHHKNNIEYI